MGSLATQDTYNDVLTKAAYKVGETVVDTGALRQSWLKDALQDVSNRRRWSWYLTTGTGIPIVTNIATYNLASDFVEDAMYQVKRTDASGNDWYYLPIFEWQAQNYTNASIGTPSVYYIRGNRADGYTITLLPTPDSTQSGNTLNYKYYKGVTDYDSLTDKALVPDTTVLVLGVAKEIFRSQNRLDMYLTTREEYEAAIADLEKTDTETERALQYSFISTQDYLGTPNDSRNLYDTS